MRLSLAAGIFALALLTPQSSTAATVFATYTVTGSAGNWDLDFTLNSNLVGPDHQVYLWAVFLNGGTQTGEPAGWVEGTLDPSSYGGPAGSYDAWQDPSDIGFPNPGSLSGFLAHFTTPTVPTSFAAVAFSYAQGTDYPGAFDFNIVSNPGFVFEAVDANATPEPGTLSLLCAALTGLGLLRLRVKR